MTVMLKQAPRTAQAPLTSPYAFCMRACPQRWALPHNPTAGTRAGGQPTVPCAPTPFGRRARGQRAAAASSVHARRAARTPPAGRFTGRPPPPRISRRHSHLRRSGRTASAALGTRHRFADEPARLRRAAALPCPSPSRAPYPTPLPSPSQRECARRPARRPALRSHPTRPRPCSRPEFCNVCKLAREGAPRPTAHGHVLLKCSGLTPSAARAGGTWGWNSLGCSTPLPTHARMRASRRHCGSRSGPRGTYRAAWRRRPSRCALRCTRARRGRPRRRAPARRAPRAPPRPSRLLEGAVGSPRAPPGWVRARPGGPRRGGRGATARLPARPPALTPPQPRHRPLSSPRLFAGAVCSHEPPVRGARGRPGPRRRAPARPRRRTPPARR